MIKIKKLNDMFSVTNNWNGKMLDKGLIFTDSLLLATFMGRRHDNVLKSIENIIRHDENRMFFDKKTFEHTRHPTIYYICPTGLKLVVERMKHCESTQKALFNLLEETTQRYIGDHFPNGDEEMECGHSQAAPAEPTTEQEPSQEPKYNIPQTYAEALRLAADLAERVEMQQRINEQQDMEIAERKQEIAKMKPSAMFGDAVVKFNQCVSVQNLAKLITQNGYEIGERRLFAWMRENGYLCDGGDDHNMPTQRALVKGLFVIKQKETTLPTGDVKNYMQTCVTGKGQIFFTNHFLMMAIADEEAKRQQKE